MHAISYPTSNISIHHYGSRCVFPTIFKNWELGIEEPKSLILGDSHDWRVADDYSSARKWKTKAII